MARQKIRDTFLQIRLEKGLKEKAKMIAEEQGKTVTELLTEFIREATLKNKVELS